MGLSRPYSPCTIPFTELSEPRTFHREDLAMRHAELPLSGFVLLLGALVQTVGIAAARAEDLPVVNDVDLQPLAAQIRRVVEALDILGQPLASAEKAGIDKATDSTDHKASVQALQAIVDRHCLIAIDINPESRVKAVQGPAA